MSIHVPTVPPQAILPESFNGLAASGDGTELAICVGQERIEIFEAGTGKLLRLIPTVQKEQGPDPKLFFSPDGRIVGTICNSTGFWEVASGKPLLTFSAKDASLITATIRTDGTVLGVEEAGSASGFYLRDVLAGKRLFRFDVPGPCTAAAFSPDGRWLALAERDITIAIWNIDALIGPVGATAPSLLSRQLLQNWWTDLASDNASVAYRACVALSHAPKQAVPFLEERVRPAVTPDSARVAGLLRDLDSPEYGVRARANSALEDVAEACRPILRKALRAHPGPDKEKRLQQLLELSERWPPTPGRMRQWRAVMALEQSNTPQSHQLLCKLAAGLPEHWLTREAAASLQRLARRKR